MRLLYLLFSVYFGLLSCLPPNADAHELTESLALRNHHEQAHHDSTLLDFLLDHYAGQSHSHDDHGNDQKHQSLPFHHAHDCSNVLVAWTTPAVVFLTPPPALALADVQLTDYAAGAPTGVATTCWQPPRA
ncbi:hypothetical protein [Hymenobacter antarcticus]|uniref:Uncharacterized protein n=1 Tax=Hymenobacter antarcticus TaxID=486270 RepID=A0ABP7Q3C8_9BACT